LGTRFWPCVVWQTLPRRRGRQAATCENHLFKGLIEYGDEGKEKEITCVKGFWPDRRAGTILDGSGFDLTDRAVKITWPLFSFFCYEKIALFAI
jgi:hypothetical protein